jgi:uncharacterized transporter YbjL
MRKGVGFWALQGPGWAFVVLLIVGQGIAAFDYELAVRMGTQDSADAVTEVGAAFWYGFAFGDLVTYIPILVAGLVGHWLARMWGRVLLAAALGITVYWPIVCLATDFAARDAAGWNPANETAFWIVLPLVALWGAWGLWYLARAEYRVL